MTRTDRYQFEQRPNGKGAVVRVSPAGTKRVINTYTNQKTAMDLVTVLNEHKHLEA